MKNKGSGEFEELVLLAVCILEGEAYGISVKKDVEKHSGRVNTSGSGAYHTLSLAGQGISSIQNGWKFR
jgi:PadR family transcriptional regulator PadR